MTGALGVLHYPLGEDFGVSTASPRTVRRVYLRALAFKANPRDARYMRELFTERHPDGEIVSPGEPGWAEAVARADEVVILYPDSTGLGFGAFERQIGRLTSAPVTVLNGRRREFALDRPTRRTLRLRRALERTMLGEIVLLPLLALVTPPLVALDRIRGHR